MKLTRKKRNIVILSVVLLMAIVIAVVLLLQDDSTIEQNYNIKDTKTITKIIIDDKDERTLKLEKINDSTWQVNGRAANMKMIESLLSTFKDMRVREPIARAARNNIVKQLAASGKKVQVYQKDYAIDLGFLKLFEREKVSKTYFIGSETQDNMGTYAMLKGEEEPCVIYIPSFKGYLSSRFSAIEDIWRSHAVFKYNKDDIASLRVEIPNQQSESFELTKNGDGFDFVLLESGAKLPAFDTVKVVALLSSLFELNYESVAKNIDQVEKDQSSQNNLHLSLRLRIPRENKINLKHFQNYTTLQALQKGKRIFIIFGTTILTWTEIMKK